MTTRWTPAVGVRPRSLSQCGGGPF